MSKARLLSTTTFALSLLAASAAMAQNKNPLPQAQPAPAPEFSLYTGGKAGSYFNDFGPRIVSVLQSKRFAHERVVSGGTGENFMKVCQNGNDVALGQADVLPELIAANPSCKIVVTNTVAKECLFGVSAIAGMDDLFKVMKVSFNLKVGVLKKGSGHRATWENLKKLHPELAELTEVEVADVPSGIEAVKQKAIDVFFFVNFPNAESKPLMTVSEAGLNYVSVGSFEIFEQKIGDQAVYSDDTVVVQNAAWNKKLKEVKTACTSTVIFTGDPARTDLKKGGRFQSVLVETLRTTPAEQLRPADSWLTSFMNSSAKKAAELKATASDPEKRRKAWEDIKKKAEDFKLWSFFPR
jgi:TRAP-type uncharacterized transport system substrate-binding protein